MEMKFSKLNKRQEAILNLIDKRFKISVSEIVLDLAQKFPKASRITVIRDLNQLLKFNFISRIGRGRSVVYQLSNQYNLLKPIDADRYFKIGPDQREAKKSFNFKIVDALKNIFIADEEKHQNNRFQIGRHSFSFDQRLENQPRT